MTKPIPARVDVQHKHTQIINTYHLHLLNLNFLNLSFHPIHLHSVKEVNLKMQ